MKTTENPGLEHWARLSAEAVTATSDWWPFMEDDITREEHIDQMMRSARAYLAPVLAALRQQVEALTHDGLTAQQSQVVLKREVLDLIDTGGMSEATAVGGAAVTSDA